MKKASDMIREVISEMKNAAKNTGKCPMCGHEVEDKKDMMDKKEEMD